MVFTQISRADAIEWLNQYTLIDPVGVDTVETVCQRGDPYLIDTGNGKVVLILECKDGTCWVSAAGGEYTQATQTTLHELEKRAKSFGLKRVCFQTVRRGLVRLTQKIGYRATPKGCGWHVEKAITHEL